MKLHALVSANKKMSIRIQNGCLIKYTLNLAMHWLKSKIIYLLKFLKRFGIEKVNGRKVFCCNFIHYKLKRLTFMCSYEFSVASG